MADVSGILSPQSDRWRIVVYSVFGDESHDETNARVFAVAGLFGSEEDWGALVEKWGTRLGNRVFHAAECDSDTGDFSSIGHAENKALYKDLTHILCDSGIIGFGCAMDLAGHREFFPGVPADIPYFRCFRDVITQCSKWARAAIPQGSVRFTFDSRRESNYNAGVLYDYLVNLPEWKVGADFEEISFSSRKKIEIQAADLYTREVMKHLDNMIGPVKRPTRRSFDALQKTHRFGADLFMREHWEDFRRQFAELADRQGISAQRYSDWLKAHKISDGISARHRYLIHIDQQRGKEVNLNP